jgi:hypothetical protein
MMKMLDLGIGNKESMKTNLITLKKNGPYSNIVWKDAEGNTYRFYNMTTSHLFYCFRMYYNLAAKRHNLPIDDTLKSHLKASSKLDDYSIADWMQAFAHEIIFRDDLEPKLMYQFNNMMSVLLKNNKQIEDKGWES